MHLVCLLLLVVVTVVYGWTLDVGCQVSGGSEWTREQIEDEFLMFATIATPNSGRVRVPTREVTGMAIAVTYLYGGQKEHGVRFTGDLVEDTDPVLFDLATYMRHTLLQNEVYLNGKRIVNESVC